ncbi:hypothetical protein C8R43DRAFT_940375 [Mycena crocata]|nr:hypothetical protein C8R43DRAFT_940375 [Mycena crocata]
MAVIIVPLGRLTEDESNSQNYNGIVLGTLAEDERMTKIPGRSPRRISVTAWQKVNCIALGTLARGRNDSDGGPAEEAVDQGGSEGMGGCGGERESGGIHPCTGVQPWKMVQLSRVEDSIMVAWDPSYTSASLLTHNAETWDTAFRFDARWRVHVHSELLRFRSQGIDIAFESSLYHGPSVLTTRCRDYAPKRRNYNSLRYRVTTARLTLRILAILTNFDFSYLHGHMYLIAPRIESQFQLQTMLFNQQNIETSQFPIRLLNTSSRRLALSKSSAALSPQFTRKPRRTIASNVPSSHRMPGSRTPPSPSPSDSDLSPVAGALVRG